jgi:hypothetical protein
LAVTGGPAPRREIFWTTQAREDLAYWEKKDRRIARRIRQLIENTAGQPFAGIGKLSLRMSPFLKWGLSLFAFVFFVEAQAACRVIDPELQESYAGECVNGLAEGFGYASGTAEYRGGFRKGMKHGQGEKTWPNGDRYEGGFVEDHKEGQGVYSWGRGPWAGERYEGGYLNDRRHGFGVYRWNTGDVYSGPWENDIATGAPTPMMLAKRKFDEEARLAVAKEGQKGCREMPIGIALSEWIRGTVVGVAEERVGVRIDEPGKQPHVVAGVEARKGEVVWDLPQGWTPCYE